MSAAGAETKGDRERERKRERGRNERRESRRKKEKERERGSERLPPPTAAAYQHEGRRVAHGQRDAPEGNALDNVLRKGGHGVVPKEKGARRERKTRATTAAAGRRQRPSFVRGRDFGRVGRRQSGEGGRGRKRERRR